MAYTLEQADVVIDLAQQTLSLPKHNKFYVISSGKNGIGEQENSGKTPRGWHRVAQKVGENSPQNSVFIARQPTGEVYDQQLAQQFPQRDWILSRILWLDGLEQGFNHGEGCDTFKRYIYIHGTPDTEPMGIPMSHGCIRMKNDEIIELFDLISEDALVYISEHSLEKEVLK
ncbi:cell wall-recycling L,D-carboxypeptidase ElsL [Acinetobacter venetianus]|jgi:lipoprotein-anchoring transpeptidase ErfK/SrfK|uniref:L,D-transpeptidase catalytic domain n=2 Tax=Moraxellaceae TaxID=468 RepID=A0A150HLZ8_9GAMM|nr:cell wall-recycling L,D-carboxypeptidase ElsL [Acinetobacter venetianus]KXZ66624.1 L,D-transpeptidase catalytic domain [Acinetobacter venetianus]MCR4529999.1 cell wall-recycling L,D-carboxypeptidase ElsL [Acinetobacter venetianus]MDA0695433.1 cell wall-recycling L,D-carboxypeptidase ElsL [Pseudomonadota bacterium]MDA1253641.1 cell wall-recycling L,D-carboxypeptidase ElsL [Pseudomonadota bacterium]